MTEELPRAACEGLVQPEDRVTEYEARTQTCFDVAVGVARDRGFSVDRTEVLQDSNRVVVLLKPAEVVARVQDTRNGSSMRVELDLVTHLAAAGAPVGLPVGDDVEIRGEHEVTLWRYYPQPGNTTFDPAQYAGALLDLHRALADVPMVGFDTIERRSDDVRWVFDGQAPALPDADRAFLRDANDILSARIAAHPARRQILHTEPSANNMLLGPDGLLFIDFELPCCGPVEFDVGFAPERVADYYPGLDVELLHWCRLLAWTHESTWCFFHWEHSDVMRRRATNALQRVRRGASTVAGLAPIALPVPSAGRP